MLDLNDPTLKKWPGWYIQFLIDLVNFAPKPGEISEGVANKWHDDLIAMKKELQKVLILPCEPDAKKHTTGGKDILDTDARPRIPDVFGCRHHLGRGTMALEKRADGKLYADDREVFRRLSESQKAGKVADGHVVWQELGAESVLNATFGEYLFDNPQIIPDEYKEGIIYFWGTIFYTLGKDKEEWVAYLQWVNNDWRLSYAPLDVIWEKDDFSAELKRAARSGFPM